MSFDIASVASQVQSLLANEDPAAQQADMEKIAELFKHGSPGDLVELARRTLDDLRPADRADLMPLLVKTLEGPQLLGAFRGMGSGDLSSTDMQKVSQEIRHLSPDTLRVFSRKVVPQLPPSERSDLFELMGRGLGAEQLWGAFAGLNYPSSLADRREFRTAVATGAWAKVHEQFEQKLESVEKMLTDPQVPHEMAADTVAIARTKRDELLALHPREEGETQAKHIFRVMQMEATKTAPDADGRVRRFDPWGLIGAPYAEAFAKEMGDKAVFEIDIGQASKDVAEKLAPWLGEMLDFRDADPLWAARDVKPDEAGSKKQIERRGDILERILVQARGGRLWDTVNLVYSPKTCDAIRVVALPAGFSNYEKGMLQTARFEVYRKQKNEETGETEWKHVMMLDHLGLENFDNLTDFRLDNLREFEDRKMVTVKTDEEGRILRNKDGAVRLEGGDAQLKFKHWSDPYKTGTEIAALAGGLAFGAGAVASSPFLLTAGGVVAVGTGLVLGPDAVAESVKNWLVDDESFVPSKNPENVVKAVGAFATVASAGTAWGTVLRSAAELKPIQSGLSALSAKATLPNGKPVWSPSQVEGLFLRDNMPKVLKPLSAGSIPAQVFASSGLKYAQVGAFAYHGFELLHLLHRDWGTLTLEQKLSRGFEVGSNLAMAWGSHKLGVVAGRSKNLSTELEMEAFAALPEWPKGKSKELSEEVAAKSSTIGNILAVGVGALMGVGAKWLTTKGVDTHLMSSIAFACYQFRGMVAQRRTLHSEYVQQVLVDVNKGIGDLSKLTQEMLAETIGTKKRFDKSQEAVTKHAEIEAKFDELEAATAGKNAAKWGVSRKDRNDNRLAIDVMRDALDNHAGLPMQEAAVGNPVAIDALAKSHAYMNGVKAGTTKAVQAFAPGADVPSIINAVKNDPVQQYVPNVLIEQLNAMGNNTLKYLTPKTLPGVLHDIGQALTLPLNIATTFNLLYHYGIHLSDGAALTAYMFAWPNSRNNIRIDTTRVAQFFADKHEKDTGKKDSSITFMNEFLTSDRFKNAGKRIFGGWAWAGAAMAFSDAVKFGRGEEAAAIALIKVLTSGGFAVGSWRVRQQEAKKAANLPFDPAEVRAGTKQLGLNIAIRTAIGTAQEAYKHWVLDDHPDEHKTVEKNKAIRATSPTS